MPGKQKKSPGGKESPGNAESSNLAEVSVGGSSSANYMPLANISDFTKALVIALNDPGVKQGFENILRPMITKYVDDMIKPVINGHVEEAIKPMVAKQVSESLNPIESRMDDMVTNLAMTNDAITSQKTRDTTANEKLLMRISELERMVRSRNLRVSGLVPSDSINEDQDLQGRYKEALSQIIQEAGIEGVATGNVLEFKRINTPNTHGSDTTVLLKFDTDANRDRLFYQRKKLKNCSKKCYVNEDLTIADARLFKKTRMEVKSGELHACWTKGGAVWAKSTPEGKPFIVPH
jgi:hypothetical protein